VVNQETIMRLLVPVLLVLLPAAGSAQDAAGDLEPLFNGKDLAGWKVPDPNPWWTVKDGVLVGENDEKLKGHSLFTERTFTDVVVEAEVRWSGEIDSGIFLRKGWQCQIGVSRSLKRDMTCSIYARGKYENQAKGVEALLKKDDWNRIRIEAKGDVFRIFLNGEKVLDVEDRGFPGPGPVGLQIHGGLKMKVEFRSLKARAL
jgi:hypothetical protein